MAEMKKDFAACLSNKVRVLCVEGGVCVGVGGLVCVGGGLCVCAFVFVCMWGARVCVCTCGGLVCVCTCVCMCAELMLTHRTCPDRISDRLIFDLTKYPYDLTFFSGKY